MAQVLVQGATIIDGSGTPPLPNGTMVIEDGVITSVERGAPRPQETSATIIDAEGCYIVPGLWDAHTHLYDWMGELYLAHGVTTVVDVGNYIDWILAQRDGVSIGRIRGPRIYACGHALGGHDIFASQRHMSLVLSGPDDARRLARWQIERGVDAIKMWVFATTPEIAAAADEARQAGLPVIGHLSTSATDAANAGLDILAHATGLAPACVTDPRRAEWLVEAERRRIRGIYTHESAPSSASMYCEMEPSRFSAVIEGFIERGVYIEPDLIFKWIFALDEESDEYEGQDYVTLNSPGLEYIPAYAHRRLATAWNNRRLLNHAQRDEIKRAFDMLCRFLRLFVDAGGRLLTGSDTTSWPIPGISICREASLLCSTLGLSNMEGLRCATAYPAQSMSKDSILGTLEPGKQADFLILDNNPLDDLRTLGTPREVFISGERVDISYHSDFANPIPKPSIGLTHSNPIPRIDGGTPTSATQGDERLHLALQGSGFVRASVVVWDGMPVPTSVRSWNEIEADVPDFLLARPGTFSVFVRNPSPVRVVDALHDDERSNVFEVVVRFS